MKASLVLLLVTLGAVTAYAAGVPGGLHDEIEADDEVRQVLREMHSNIERMTKSKFEKIEALTYRKQIVAGRNYFIRALATDHHGKTSHVHLRVYRPFRGEMELTAVKNVMDRSAPLEYFQ